MTDVDDYMTMLRESQLKCTIVVKDVDKIISENARLKSEYKAECKRSDELEDSYWKEVDKNKKLKDLLKECRPYIALYTENNKHIGFTPETANLLQRIKEVLK